MKILSAQQMRELDAYTIQAENIASIELMERAARALVFAIKCRWKEQTPIVVFAGPGNNGGDALAVARLLSADGYKVKTYLLNPSDKLSTDCQQNKERLEARDDADLTEVSSQFEPPALTEKHLIIDGLFGTGLNKPLSGGYASLTKFINDSPAMVVSIDIPSGLMCEDNSKNTSESIVCADLTLTFQLPKLALLLADNQRYVGELQILDIRLSQEKIEDTPTSFSIIEETYVSSLLKQRAAFGHKGTFGHVLVVAGSYGMAGAATLAAKGALRSGAGKVTIHCPLRNNDIHQISLPEAILSHDPDERVFTQPVSLEAYNAMTIGPGIGTDVRTAKAFFDQVKGAKIPVLIDADGINILGANRSWIQYLPQGTILTPHPLELKRLTGLNCDSYTTLMETRNMARLYQFFIIIKGHRTAICTPDGEVFFNATGNSGMGTAGSGDVLSGIISALCAAAYSPKEACLLGVYLHGLAGDLAAAQLGEDGLTASDIVRFLPKAFVKLRESTQVITTKTI